MKRHYGFLICLVLLCAAFYYLLRNELRHGFSTGSPGKNTTIPAPANDAAQENKPNAAAPSAPAAPASSSGTLPKDKGICPAYWKKLPNLKLSLCEAAQLQDTGVRSVKGQPILMRDIVQANAQIRVLVVGGIHGDEYSSISTAFHWLHLTESEPVAMRQNVHWRFIPALNPDGIVVQRRTNARGVDLNRNFPTPHWQRDAPQYWEKRTGKDPRRWPGKSAVSEPESQFLHQQIEQFQPHLVISIHAPYGVLDFDGPATPPSKLGRLYLDQVGIFPGSLGHYAGVHKGVPVVTIELPQALKTPLDSEIRQMWLDLLRWVSENIPQKRS